MKEINIKLELGPFQGAYTILENEVPVCYTWDEKSAERVKRGLQLVQDEELSEEYYRGMQEHNERVATQLKTFPGIECWADPNISKEELMQCLEESCRAEQEQLIKEMGQEWVDQNDPLRLIDVWKVTVGGVSCYLDNEQEAKDMAGEFPPDEVKITQEKMTKYKLENLPEFDGF